MALPTLSGTGRLTADVELRFSSSGMAIATIPLAFNSRKKNQQTGEWEDGDVLFIRGTMFREPAESAAESLHKGIEVVVTGRIKLDQWNDKQSGDKRSAPSLLVDSIGPALTKQQQATVGKASPAPQQQQSSDPWGSSGDDAPF